MFISLDSGRNAQIIKLDGGYQLVEVVERYSEKGRMLKFVRKVGGEHKDFLGVIGELANFELNNYEVASLEEVCDMVKTTMLQIKEKIDLQTEYLSTL